MWNSYRKKKGSKTKCLRYREARNRVTAAVRWVKHILEHKLAEEVGENPRAFYAYARSCITLKEDVRTVRKCDGTQTSTIRETCEMMNHEYEVFTTVIKC